jgi:hypothetical protein
VLELPDDFFPDEASQVEPLEPPSTTSGTSDPEPSEDTLSQELKLELAYLFMELDELSEAVYSAFFDVKLQRKAIVEAAAVAKITIDCAMSVIARWELHHGS